MTLLSIGDLEGFLKYGFPGLVVIFGILIYFLFRTQFNKELTNRDFFIRTIPFIVITIALLTFAYFSIYQDKKFQQISESNKAQKQIDSLKTELLIYQGRSPSTESNQNNFDRILHLKDSLESQIKILEKNVKTKDEYLSQTLMIQITGSFETILGHTLGKHNSSDPDFNNKVVKNAVFQNILAFGADTSVLRKAIYILINRYDLKNVNVNSILLQTPKLYNIRRTWLKKTILQLENALEANGPKQQGVEIEVELPQEVWILNKPYIVFLTDDALSTLTLEKELLDKKTLL